MGAAISEKLRMVRLVRPRDLLRPARLRLIRAVSGNTLLPHRRLSHIADLASHLPPGAIVECGTYLGGSAAVLARTQPDRQVWLFDSWEGCPAPTANDIGLYGEPGRAGDFAAPREEAERFLYETMSLDPDRVQMVPGWFADTLPVTAEAIGPIALLHLDGDWYESTMTALVHLYDRVVPGGIVVIDDYGYWKGCRDAVDEFLAGQGAEVRIEPFDGTQVHWRR